MELKYKKIGFVVKPHKDVKSYLMRSIEIVKKSGAEYTLEYIASKMLGLEGGVERSQICSLCDLIVLIGGDGTFLSIAESAVKNNVPIAGFNLGTLGFLTELKKENLKDELEDLLTGKLPISERKLIETKKDGKYFLSLNDVVISKGDIARIIKFDIEIDGEKITTLRADGLILSTPTGSTAYSLSAGGPILDPKVNGLVVTPICPHSLTLRPFIISDSSEVKVILEKNIDNVFITIDGQKVLPVKGGKSFSAKTYDRKLKMIISKDLNYFTLLSEKLNWGI